MCELLPDLRVVLLNDGLYVLHDFGMEDVL